MTWRRWAGQQLAGLVAVVVGLVVATLVLDDDWGLSAWLVFLGAWLAVTAVQAALRARRAGGSDER
ncbi:hypothetical protein [Angustibacter sp. Root456]|uniref:hypothetical protein n=1 Tax=Angustibacter sp. Root456 TaxID=1736539 RepID=UPI0006FDE8AA|nr:hypothetical protein [Angustibacter sp. Root456]KQX65710.1 hypothetical protein ASD06_08785 [Angustibacter sp. Root456]